MALVHQGIYTTITVIIVHLSALDSNSLKGWGPWNTSLHGSLEAPIPYLPQQFVSGTVIKSCKSIFYILKNDFQHCQLNSPCFWLQRFTRNSHPSGKLRFKSTPIQDEPGFATWKQARSEHSAQCENESVHRVLSPHSVVAACIFIPATYCDYPHCQSHHEHTLTAINLTKTL